ncbi:borealin-like [Mugil cephalus]|uniref:borealin-like n=1 Tax=Mugil cephalus TaxID=48193 RepID=UPI001FB79DE3|nr:borealin-like [Mugil cephalus]
MAPRKKTNKQAKKNPKTEKLEAFLEDFDSEVKTRVEHLKEQMYQLLKDVDNSYNMAIITLPLAVRQMSWLENCKSEKLKSPQKDEAKREEGATAAEGVVAAALLKTAKTSKKNVEAKSGSEDETTSSATSRGKITKKPPSKRAKALAAGKQSTARRRSSRKPLITPARSMLESSLMMGRTPLVTPRFDPRLPQTPAVRVPRHKERVYSISVNGSPIAAGNEDIVINVPISNGESIQLLASQMDSVDLSLLDETALKSIRLLQNRLATLCGTAE